MTDIKIDDIIAVVGGSGFIGAHVIKQLAKTGAQIRVISRNPVISTEIRTCGAVGQIWALGADANDKEALLRALGKATYVVNLVGVLNQKGRQSFSRIHIEAARNIAECCAELGSVKRLVYISALGVDKASTSKYAITKLAGEKEVIKAFKHTVILRPSVVFGPEDNFFNQFATLSSISPVLPLIGGGQTKLQPVYVGDVAKAIEVALTENKEKVEGKFFELGGPKVYTLKEIIQYVLQVKNRKRCLVSLPYSIAALQGYILQLLPTPPFTADQVELLKYPNILQGKPGLKELGVTPTPVESIVPDYL
jgi:NADH dehydrogenase